jgi:hypothetical protein
MSSGAGRVREVRLGYSIDEHSHRVTTRTLLIFTMALRLVTSTAYAEPPVAEKKADGVMANLCGSHFRVGEHYKGQVPLNFRTYQTVRVAYYDMKIEKCDQWVAGVNLVYHWIGVIDNREKENAQKKVRFFIVGNQLVHDVASGWGEMTKFIFEPRSDGSINMIFQYQQPDGSPWQNSGVFRPTN